MRKSIITVETGLSSSDDGQPALEPDAEDRSASFYDSEESINPPEPTCTPASSTEPREEFSAQSAPVSDSPSVPMDIGILLKNDTLTQGTKLKLLNHTPDSNFNYPTKYMNGCNRRFKPEWVKSHSWLLLKTACFAKRVPCLLLVKSNSKN